MTGKYSQKLLYHAKQSTTDALKTFWKRVIQKAAEATGDLSGNKLTSLKKLTTKCFKDTYKWAW